MSSNAPVNRTDGSNGESSAMMTKRTTRSRKIIVDSDDEEFDDGAIRPSRGGARTGHSTKRSSKQQEQMSMASNRSMPASEKSTPRNQQARTLSPPLAFGQALEDEYDEPSPDGELESLGDDIYFEDQEGSTDPNEQDLFGQEDDPELGFLDEDDDIYEEPTNSSSVSDDEDIYEAPSSASKRKAKTSKSSCRPAKASCSSQGHVGAEWKSAKDFVDYTNRITGISESDPDVRKGRQMLLDWFSGLQKFASGLSHDWFTSPLETKGIANWVVALVKKVQLHDIEHLIFGHIPLIGFRSLARSVEQGPEAFLDIPMPPEKLPFRATYLNIAADIGEDNVVLGKSPYTGRLNVKLPKDKDWRRHVKELKLYEGATSFAAHCRWRGHENNPVKQPFLHKPGVVSNWRPFGIFPLPPEDNPSGQDPGKALPFFLEGMLQSVTGLVGINTRPYWENPPSYASERSFELCDSFREGLELPNLARFSLNKVWSLNQGLRNVRARKCANPKCLATSRHVGQTPEALKQPFYMTVCELRPLQCADTNTLPLSYCRSCTTYYRDPKTQGTLPDRWNNFTLMSSFNRFRQDHINDWWLASKPQRKRRCGNCEVAIPKDATVFGMMNDMKCFRCAHYRVLNRAEWQAASDIVQTNDKSCDSCGNSKIPLTFRSARTSNNRGNDSGLNQWVCSSCDPDWVVYGPKQLSSSRSRALFETHPRFCHELDCQTDGAGMKPGIRLVPVTQYVHDIEQDVWRCLPCDFAYCEKKRASDPGFSQATTHHLNKDRKCSLCPRWYTFFPTWTPDDDGVSKCGECAARKCANEHCSGHKADAETLFKFDPFNKHYCFRCVTHLRKQTTPKENFHLQEARTRRLPKYVVAETRQFSPQTALQCGHCSKTGLLDNVWRWRPDTTTEDLSNLRCAACYAHYLAHRVERPLVDPPLSPVHLAESLGAAAECHDCHKSGPGTKWRFRYQSTDRTATNLVCSVCYLRGYNDITRRGGRPANHPKSPAQLAQEIGDEAKCRDCGGKPTGSQKWKFEFESDIKDASTLMCSRCWQRDRWRKKNN